MSLFDKMNKEDKEEFFEIMKTCFFAGFEQSNYEFNNEASNIPEHFLEHEEINQRYFEEVLKIEFEKFFLNSINERQTFDRSEKRII